MYCGLTNQSQKCKLHILFNNNKNSLIYPLIDYKCITTLQQTSCLLYRSIVKVSNSQLFNLYRLIFLLLKKYQSDLPDQLQKYERSNHLEIQKYNVCRTGHGSLTYPLTANVSEDMSDQLQKCQKSNHICFQYISKGLQLSALSSPKNHSAPTYIWGFWGCARTQFSSYW